MDKIQALIDKRDEFLKENPHLIPLQEKIDNLLEGRTQIQKCEMLNTILISQSMILREKLLEVVDLVKEIT